MIIVFNFKSTVTMKQKLLSLGFVLLAIFAGQKVFAYDFEVNGIGYTVTSIENLTVAVDGFSESLSGTIEVPSFVTYNNRTFSVTSIKSARSTSNSIASVLLPASITEIERYAFKNSSITDIQIPDNVTNIGEGAFEKCANLYSVKISKNVKNLNKFLFMRCSSLTKVDWHPDCNYGNIYGGVFWYCSSLKTIRIPKGICLSGSIEGPSHTTIFKDCTSLDSLIIEDGTGIVTVPYYYEVGSKYLGEFSGSKINYVYLGKAFKDESTTFDKMPVLYYVEHLEIGDKVTELPTWLPNRQEYSLKTLIIGSSLTKVRDFSGTRGSSLEFIKIRRSTPPVATGFSNYNYMNTILYVPRGAKAAYESADIWKNFWNIQEFSDEGTNIETIMSEENGNAVIFTIDGKRVDNLKTGLNVIRMKDGTTRKVVVK